MNVGENIKRKRIELGLTQEELAIKCGYKSRSSINKIELSRDLPLSKVGKAAAALNCTPSELLGWEENLNEENANFQIEMLLDSKYMDYAKKLFYADESNREKIYSYIDFIIGK